MYIRTVFIDFVQGLLNMDPIKRWSPQQAKLHPFITGERFTGHWEVSSCIRSPRAIVIISSRSFTADSEEQCDFFQ